MLKPYMKDLMQNINNKYLIVNIAARRARDIAEDADERGDILDDKPVKIALTEIAEGKIHYKND